MKVRFWGVRGSLPTPGRSTVRYGGNTSCVEVRAGERRLIFDAGSGLVPLAAAMAAETGVIDVDLLLSHTHYDHICGLPFFSPLFRLGNKVRIWAGRLNHGVPAETTLRASLTAPLNPDLASSIQAQVEYREFAAGSVLDLGGGVTARTAMLQHPGGSIAYRIEWSGRAMVYATDTGHGDAAMDMDLLGLCQGAGMLIYDAMLTDEEFPGRVSWGHSTWRAGTHLADDAGVRQLVLFHHAPMRNDRAMAALEAEARAARPMTVAAREGMRLTVASYRPAKALPSGPRLRGGLR
jgi:phosphoribosyl 1,2-cyclic phosphodiesterase